MKVKITLMLLMICFVAITANAQDTDTRLWGVWELSHMNQTKLENHKSIEQKTISLKDIMRKGEESSLPKELILDIYLFENTAGFSITTDTEVTPGKGSFTTKDNQLKITIESMELPITYTFNYEFEDDKLILEYQTENSKDKSIINDRILVFKNLKHIKE